MGFGDVIRSANSQGYFPSGIGGQANKIWHCDGQTDKIYELAVSDFSVVRSGNPPVVNPEGIGGDASKIWMCTANGDKVYELSTSDFSSIRSASSPSTFPRGIGGDASKIWHCDEDSESVYELSTSDLSVVRSATAPCNFPYGIGGTASLIWFSGFQDTDSLGKTYALSTSDFSVICSADAQSHSPYGIGGDSDTIWHSDVNKCKVYELEETPPPQPPSAPTGLVCNGQSNPIDVIPFDFQAIYNDPNPGDIAQYFRLQVNTKSDFTGRTMWDSGKIPMSDTAEGTYCPLIYYNGQALSLNKLKYYWRIKFWDDEDQEGEWSDPANFTMAGSGAGEMGAGPWEEGVLEPSGAVKVEIPRRSGQWTTLEDIMRIHTSVNKNPLDAIEIAQAEVKASNISKNFNSFEEASDWYKQLEGFALQLSVGCKVGGTPISRKLFTGIISSADADRLSQTAELKVVDFLDYFGRVTIKETPIWENISLTQLYKNLVELAFPEWVEGVDYFVEDLGDITVPAIGYENLNLLSELKNIAESRGKRIFTDVNGKLVCRSRSPEGEPWIIKNDYNLEDVKERRDLNNVYNWIVVHARPHEIKPDLDPPGKISDFTATPGDQKIDLSWSNPTDDDFEKVLIRCSMTSYPAGIEDGTKIYEGTGQSKSHTGLTNGKRYYYSGFTKDSTGNWSAAAHTSAVAGVGGGQWEDDTSISRVYGFTATPEHSKIILTWFNPRITNFEKVIIRGSITSYPSSPTSGGAVYDGTGESTTDTGLTNGTRYYYSAFVKNTKGVFSGASFATAIPAGLRKAIDTEIISGGGCLADQSDIPRDWKIAYGCFYAGTSGFAKRELYFTCRARSQNWLRFRHEWDVQVTQTVTPSGAAWTQEHRIGIDDDLSLSFSKSLGGLVQVTVSVISVSTKHVRVEYKLVYTGPRGIRWDFYNKLSLMG